MKRKKGIFRKKNIKRQDRKRRYRLWGRAALVLVILGMMAGGARFALKNLDLFSLQKILVTGDPKTISETQVLQRIQIPLGTNLYSLDLPKIRNQLKGNEFFKKISVHRRWPHTLVVHIEEYQTEFLLYTTRYYYVDRSGVIFKDITDSQDSRDWVIFTGITEDELLSRPNKVKKTLQSGFRLKEAYLKTKFAEAFGVSEIHYDKNIGFTLYPEKQKYSIKFGYQDFGEKIEKLSQVLEKLHQNKVKFSSIDLNYPGKVLMTL